MNTLVVPSHGGELDDPAAKQLLDLRMRLGMVAPRNPLTRQLGPRQWRLNLLAELCAPETFHHVANWLGSSLFKSDKSRQDYADDIRIWAVFLQEQGFSPFDLYDVDIPLVRSYRQQEEERKRSARSIRRRMDVLSSLINYVSYVTEVTVSNPVTKLDKPKIDPQDVTTATPILELHEFQRVLGVTETPQQMWVPILVYTVAGRVSECCKASVRQVRYEDGKRRLDLRRKGGKGRIFTLPSELYGLMDIVTGGSADGPLVMDDEGNPMDRHGVGRLLARLGRAAGVLPKRDLTPHVLRASKLTHMHDKGTRLEDIQEFADHVHIETTQRYIRRRDTEKLREHHTKEAAQVYAHLLKRWSS